MPCAIKDGECLGLPLSMALDILIDDSAREMGHFLFIVSILALFYQGSQGIECYRARTAIPLAGHCQALVEAIEYLSGMPGENNVRSWGRHLPTTPQTMKVPKVYWIGGRGPDTCAVHVDVRSTDLFAVDSFRQSDVARSATRVVAACLVRQLKLGLDYPTELEHVYVKIVRSDAPFLMRSFGKYSDENVSLPDSGEVLHIATGVRIQ